MAEGKKIRITQTGSHIGRTDDQRATLSWTAPRCAA
jgi:large subunit ribosomal protein L30